MDTLRALNVMLVAAGEAIVESVDTAHPLHSSLLQTLDNVSKLEQSRGWWFNEYYAVLTPDINGHIILDTDVVRIRPVSGRPFVKKGNQLMDKHTRSTVFDQPVDCFLAEEWLFEELPETFAMYVTQLAALQAGTSYDADATRMQAIATAVDLARAPMMKEHVDNARLNLFETPSMGAKMVGVRHQRYGVND